MVHGCPRHHFFTFASQDCQIPCYTTHSNFESYALFLRDQSSQTLVHEKPVGCPSQYFGVALNAFISYLWCKLLLYHFSVEGIPKMSLKRVRCWTLSGASLHPWNTLPHKYGTPSQLRKYLASVLEQSAKKKTEKHRPCPTLFPRHTLVIFWQFFKTVNVIIVQNYHLWLVWVDNLFKWTNKKGRVFGQFKMKCSLVPRSLVGFVAKRSWVAVFQIVQRVFPSIHHQSIQLYPFYHQLPYELTTITKQWCF